MDRKKLTSALRDRIKKIPLGFETQMDLFFQPRIHDDEAPAWEDWDPIVYYPNYNPDDDPDDDLDDDPDDSSDSDRDYWDEHPDDDLDDDSEDDSNDLDKCYEETDDEEFGGGGLDLMLLTGGE